LESYKKKDKRVSKKSKKSSLFATLISWRFWIYLASPS